MFSKISISLILLFVLLFACNKYEQQKTDSPLDNRTSSLSRRLTDQEIEYIGSKHNEQLTYIFNTLISQQPSFLNGAALKSYIYNFQYQINFIDEVPNPQILLQLMNGASIPNEWQYIYNSIQLILSNSNSYQELELNINTKMNELRNNEALSNDEYNVFMGGLSILKYSGNFWCPSDKGGSNLGINFLVSLHNQYPNLYPNPEGNGSSDPNSIKNGGGWKAIAEKDMVGGITDAIVYCGWMAWTGGGSVAGFVGGFIVGAVTHSAH